MADAPETFNGGRVAKNTTYLTLALLGQKILSFVYVLLLARLAGFSITGDYFGALSFITLFSIFIDLGLTQAFIRQTARDAVEGVRQFQLIITVKVISAVIVVAALFGTIAVLDAYGRSHPDILFLQWAAIIMVIDSLTLTSYGYFRGIQRLEFESFGTILHRITVMVVGITGLVFGAPPVITMIAVLSGSLANFSFVVFHLWKQGVAWRPRWHGPTVKRLLFIALPFFIAGFFSAVYASSDNVLLSIFNGRREVGLFGTANKIVVAFQILPAALVAAIFPAMSAAFIQDQARLKRIFTSSMQYLMVIAIPLMVVLILLAKEIVLLLGGSKVWLDAAWPLQVLALGLPWLFLNFPVGYLLNSSNQQTRNTINIGITVVLNVALNLIFIEQYSYRSVAVISAGSSALLFLLGLIRVRQIIAVDWGVLIRTLLKTLLAGLIIAAVGWWLLPQVHGRSGAAMAVAIMAFIYGCLIFIFRLVKRSDILSMVQRFRRS